MTRGVQTQLTEARVREIRHWFANVSDDALATDVVALADAYLAQRETIRGARTALGNAQTERTHGLTASAAFIDQCIDSAARALDAAVSVGSPETRETEE